MHSLNTVSLSPTPACTLSSLVCVSLGPFPANGGVSVKAISQAIQNDSHWWNLLPDNKEQFTPCNICDNTEKRMKLII